ncbi:MAG: molybdopterin-dependent oxidoreductase [Acidobacteriota bacterium]
MSNEEDLPEIEEPSQDVAENPPGDEPIPEAGPPVIEDEGVPPAEEDVREDDEDLRREVNRLSRRGFLSLAAAAGAGFASWKLLRTRTPEDGVAWPFRRGLEVNESLARAYFSPNRLSPQFRSSDVTKSRINGRIGLKSEIDPAAWRLRIEGTAVPVSLTLDDLRQFPRRTMTTELRCIEGWSIIVQWSGVRLADVMEKFPPLHPPSYVSVETPDRAYYVGLDLASALHPQSLLAFEMNGSPLAPLHGAPLRLAIPVKYGIKNIKRIGTIRFTNIRPPDFWGERGYDWYAGH